MISLMRGQNGTTLVENVIALPLFLFVLIIGIDLLRAAHVKLSLQYLLTEVARESQIDSAMNAQTFRHEITRRLSVFGVSLSEPRDTLTVCPVSQTPCQVNRVNLGGPREFMVYRIDKRFDLFFLPQDVNHLLVVGRSVFTLSAQVIGRNEPP